MKRVILSVVLILLIPALFGCVKKNIEKEGRSVLRIAGSTSMIPVSDKLARAYEEKHPGVVIHIEGGDSSLGIRGASGRIVDIGSVSRPLSEEEGKKLSSYIIAQDSIVVIVNMNNPVKHLTINQIKGIFSGEIKSWEEVGGLNKPITLINREHGSGTHSLFKEIVMEQVAEIDERALVMTSTGSVISTVAGDANAIGYVSSRYNTEGIKAVEIQSGENKVFELKRPLLYVIPEGAGKLAMDYINFCTGEEGQKVIKSYQEN
ncbi:MAG: phosphate ABC transporter substrate-binding protein [Bacillota bacterium]